MATTVREILAVANVPLTIFCGNKSFVGIRLTGTWVGTVAFKGSTDGVNFYPIAMTPFPSGTAVSSATANGNWFTPVANYVAIQAIITTYTSGNVSITISTSTDMSYQDAFLTQTTIFVNSLANGGANTLTQAAQANRAWTLKALKITVDRTPGWVTRPHLQLLDGVGGSVLWGIDLPTVGSSGQLYDITLPADGITASLGNAFVVSLASPGAAPVSNINAQFSAGGT